MEDCRQAFERMFPNFIDYESFWVVWQEAWKSGRTHLEIEMLAHIAHLERLYFGGTTQ